VAITSGKEVVRIFGTRMCHSDHVAEQVRPRWIPSACTCPGTGAALQSAIHHSAKIMLDNFLMAARASSASVRTTRDITTTMTQVRRSRRNRVETIKRLTIAHRTVAPSSKICRVKREHDVFTFEVQRTQRRSIAR
jgi:hypothetical protein